MFRNNSQKRKPSGSLFKSSEKKTNMVMVTEPIPKGIFTYFPSTCIVVTDFSFWKKAIINLLFYLESETSTALTEDDSFPPTPLVDERSTQSGLTDGESQGTQNHPKVRKVHFRKYSKSKKKVKGSSQSRIIFKSVDHLHLSPSLVAEEEEIPATGIVLYCIVLYLLCLSQCINGLFFLTYVQRSSPK
jgi:hypothetical protein